MKRKSFKFYTCLLMASTLLLHPVTELGGVVLAVNNAISQYDLSNNVGETETGLSEEVLQSEITKDNNSDLLTEENEEILTEENEEILTEENEEILIEENEEILIEEESKTHDELIAEQSQIDKVNDTNNVELYSEKAVGKGLVQLWFEAKPGQEWRENQTMEIINDAVWSAHPVNHDLYPSGGISSHPTYVNSYYVDDAFFLGEEGDYYKIYVSGYEGKVKKYQVKQASFDLNKDGVYEKYDIELTATYIPASPVKTVSETEDAILDVPYLEFSSDGLDKFSNMPNIISKSSSYVQSPSYYTNEDGALVHYLSRDVKIANYYKKTIVGKAPDWMKANKKYYSYDGIYFYENWQNVKVNGNGSVNSQPFYNYYQYLPFRSKTNYSSTIIDNFTSSKGYTDSSKSKLVGTGRYFYNVQDLYGINSVLQYSMGIHESGWGTSSISKNKNNLFGMAAFDASPGSSALSFKSVEEGIYYHANYYLSWGYTDPVSDSRFYGSHVGNKGSGMNVKYASDPFWGEKISGYYYQLDKANGFKDYHYYTIGIKEDNSIINVLANPWSTSKVLYSTYNKKANHKISRYPVVVIQQQDNYYKIQSDTPINSSGNVQYDAQYNWTRSVGYVDSSSIKLFINGKQELINKYVGNIDQPSNNQVNGIIEISGWYLYGNNIDRIELYIDNQKISTLPRFNRSDVANAYPQYDASKAGYSYSLNTKTLANGKHTIKIVAVGSDGTSHSMSKEIKVENKVLNYLGSIDRPVANSTVSGNVEVSGWYLYGETINKIELYLDGSKVTDMPRFNRSDVASVYPGYDASQSGYSYSLNTTRYSNGKHELKVVAIGNDGTRSELKTTININNKVAAPYIGAIDRPVANSTVSGNVEVSGWFVYGREINRIELYLDGSKVTDMPRFNRSDVASVYPHYDATKAGYSYSLNTKNYSNGTHKLTIKVIGVDDTTTSISTNIKINN